MKRLIDSDALKESFRKQTVNVQEKIKEDADAIIEAICKDVDLAPTVDAVPVSYIYKRAMELKNDDMIYAYTVLNSLIANYRSEGEK